MKSLCYSFLLLSLLFGESFARSSVTFTSKPSMEIKDVSVKNNVAEVNLGIEKMTM